MCRKEEERAERRRRAREYEEAAWAEEGSEGGSEEDAADNIPDELYCLACDKSFRTPNAFANHEKWAHISSPLSHSCLSPDPLALPRCSAIGKLQADQTFHTSYPVISLTLQDLDWSPSDPRLSQPTLSME